MRKLAFCICENKGADQLHSNRAADQCLCSRYIDSTTPLLPKSEISASSHLLLLYSRVCETPKTGFLATRFIHVSDLKIIQYFRLSMF